MAANIIESLFVALGFQVDTAGLDEMKKKTDELRESALKVGAVFTGAALGIGLLAEGVAKSMGDIASFAELNDISAKSVAALGKIATENDGSLEGMKSTIQSLNKTIGEAALGVGRGAMTFEKLGIAAKNADGKVKNVDDILSEVADKMQGLSRQEQIAMAEKLGIDPQFVKVLEKGSENLAKLREEAELLNPFSEKDYQLADEVDKLFIKAKGTLGTFTKMIGVALLPQVKEVLKTYIEWFKASRKATSGVFITALQLLSGAIGTVWDWVMRLVSGLKNVYDWLTQFKVVTYAAVVALGAFIAVKTYDFVIQLGSAIKALTLRMATFNATALLIPAIIGAIILAIGLLIDDYVNWKEGNDSVIGGLVEQFPMLLTIIQAIEQGVGAFVDFWLEQWDTLKEPLTQLAGAIWTLVSSVVSALWPVIKMVFTGWAYVMAAVIPIVATLIGWLVTGLVGAIKFVIDVLTNFAAGAAVVFNALVALVGFVVDGIVAYFTWWFNTVVAIYTAIAGMVGAVVDAVMGGVKGTVDMVMGIIDMAKQKVMGFIDTVVGAIGKVGELLGLSNSSAKVSVQVNKTESASIQPTSTAAAVSQAPSLAGPGPAGAAEAAEAATANNSLNAGGGVVGRAGNNTTNNASSTTNTTTISGTTINVSSSDPAKAGEAVKQELDKMNKQTTRNGQSAVAL